MKKVYKIPVTWEKNGFIEIEKTSKINSIQKALNYIENNLGNLINQNSKEKGTY